MNLKPLFDRVILEQMKEEAKTAGGIILPGGEKEKPMQGTVISAGPGGVIDGKEVTMQVKAGQKVIYSKYAGSDIELEGKKYVIVRQSDILAIIE